MNTTVQHLYNENSKHIHILLSKREVNSHLKVCILL